MRVLVIYESMFGNTERIAKAVAAGLGSTHEVDVLEVTQAAPDVEEQVDLLVLGAPTQGHGMSSANTRRSGKGNSYSIGIREWLERLPGVQTGMAAAFDTRFDKPRWLTGSAALKISKELSKLGYELLASPESFFVAHTEGPLAEGEEDRARLWAATLGRRMAVEVGA